MTLQNHPSSWKTLLAALMILIGLNGVILFEHFTNGLILFNEGGFIESITAQAFASTGLFLLLRLFQTQGIERDLTLMFGTTCLLFFVREIEVEAFEAPSLFKFFGADLGRDFLFSLIYLLLLTRLFMKARGALGATVKNCLSSLVSVLVITGCIFLLGGSRCENLHYVFAEELLEMNGALLIALASVIHLNTPIFSGKLTKTGF